MDRRRALMAVRPSGGGSDFFPLYVTADEVVKNEDFPTENIYIATSYADYSELYNYLCEILITKGEQAGWDENIYYLYNPEDYGIDIYIDHYANGTFYRANELNFYASNNFIELWHCDDDSWSGSALLYSDRIEWEFTKY